MKNETELKNIFLGPKAENFEAWDKYLNLIFSDYIHWRRNYFPSDKIVIEHGANNNSTWIDNLDYELNSTLNNLKAHFPFYSPRYMAHMLSEQTMPAVLGYFAGMLYNPNNVTDEAAPVTVDMELEFGEKICKMLGYKSNSNKATGWAHICSGGSIANLEALWVAREVQFIPLCVKDFCRINEIREFEIRTPSMSGEPDKKIEISKVSDRELLSLKPNERIYMLTKLIQYLIDKKNFNKVEAIDKVNDYLKHSPYSVRWAGFANVLAKINLKPVIFIPESAHYSWDKAVSILGYGNASIRRIPITSKFRINVDILKEMLNQLQNDEYIAAVVTVVGTTEEGAVDPVHQVKFIRDSLEKRSNLSFWLHVDAAWGGYIRTLFNDDNYEDLSFGKNIRGSTINAAKNKSDNAVGKTNDDVSCDGDNITATDTDECSAIDDNAQLKDENQDEEDLLEKEFKMRLSDMQSKAKLRNRTLTSLDESSLKCAVIMNIRETILDDVSIVKDSKDPARNIPLSWDDLEVIKSFMAFKDADSITVDPHKLGYVPYPAGVIAFKNKNVVQFIAQKASYISEIKGDVEKVSIDEIKSVGPYVIEGSKPGAAAVACWLSERTIPMNLHNHGKIIKATLLSAKKFYYYMQKLNSENAGVCFRKENRKVLSCPYKFVPLYDNIDTNIVCFVLVPMEWNQKAVNTNNKGVSFTKENTNLSLRVLNEINESIYKYFTIINDGDKKSFPHSQKFFLSRTKLEKNQYAYDSIAMVLNKLHVEKEEYEQYGLFVLRATLMNPWYQDAAKADGMGRKTDYFLEFFNELNRVAISVINETYKNNPF